MHLNGQGQYQNSPTTEIKNSHSEQRLVYVQVPLTGSEPVAWNWPVNGSVRTNAQYRNGKGPLFRMDSVLRLFILWN